ncbi:GNAT family N-acetyltransferase [Streptomyces sp. NPDC097619]|uniref:GNAT family N-acetyltransferase n=1 Tax=Streptomyces sp. NPDC097619 TaxID=3157228 RepID=UPI00332B1827
MTTTSPTTGTTEPTGTSFWAVAAEPHTTPAATTLRRAYYAEVAGRYWGRLATEEEVDEGMLQDPGDDLVPPSGVFLVGRYEGRPAACAGLRMLDPQTAELTRVYVDPALRGTGGGAALLAALDGEARQRGAARIRLDTRTDLVEARALYARHGYREIPAYNAGPYAQHWFEKPVR